MNASVRIGTAGWAIPLALSDEFRSEGQHLQRYARRLTCTEINSSFYRSHRAQTYERWASITPPNFRFSVKLPRTITHEAQLQDRHESLDRFLGEVAGLGEKLSVVLVQLPPSLPLESRVASKFFDSLAERCTAAVVVEPRHASWFTALADRLLIAAGVSRAGVDPAPCPPAAFPGGLSTIPGQGALRGVPYYRWHGSPRMYWSAYSTNWLRARVPELALYRRSKIEPWCIFDNTAGGAALTNALQAVQAYGASGQIRR